MTGYPAKQNNNDNYDENALSKFLYEFTKNNKSIIFDHFMGFYQKQINCQFCQGNNNYGVFMNNNNPSYEFYPYYFVHFDLNEIYNFFNRLHNAQKMNDDNQKINIDNCFNYYYMKKYNNFSYVQCNKCFSNMMAIQTFSLISLPNIITVILSNKQNINFTVQDELDLKKYTNNYQGDGLYLLMSMLCHINYNNKFICYCLNPNNGFWYSYTDGQIKKVDKIDVNAIPLVLFYEIKRNNNSFVYKGIKQDEKILLNVKIQDGRTKQLYFNKHCLITNIVNLISICFNLKESEITIIINGQRAKKYDVLSKILKKNDNNILVLIK